MLETRSAKNFTSDYNLKFIAPANMRNGIKNPDNRRLSGSDFKARRKSEAYPFYFEFCSVGGAGDGIDLNLYLELIVSGISL